MTQPEATSPWCGDALFHWTRKRKVTVYADYLS
uniref:Uncharacterized protein n=1 Tax=Anguilla anguilla TaxID=7936 RepID=A0A0E9TLL4_ANGAN